MTEPTYCSDCRLASTCEEPFANTHCERFEKRMKPSEILELFDGMSPSMQKAIVEIMKVVQEDDKKRT